MIINISTSNKKLGKFIPSINLPPIKTCRPKTPCAKGCYACKGTWNYKNVKESLNNNLIQFGLNKDNFFNEIINYLNNGDVIYKYFRWHSSGDIINLDYLKGMIEVAKKCKQTKFLAFTKQFEIVNEYLASGEKIPSNLKIVFSAWDKEFTFKNPYNLPIAYLEFKKKELNPSIPQNAYKCSGECKSCKVCWFLKRKQSVKFTQH
jgi:hypothetical protein